MATPVNLLLSKQKPLLILFFITTIIMLTTTMLCGAEDAVRMVFTKPLDVEDSRLVYFEIVEPESLRYIYIGRPAKDFGVSFNQSYASVELVIGEPTVGCSRLSNSHQVKGNSVILLRGECSFLTKTLVAEEAGALFVIISDDDEGSTNSRIDMVNDETGRKVNIPALFIAGKDGSMIRREISKSKYALLNIPTNLTAIPFHKRRHPPWTLI